MHLHEPEVEALGSQAVFVRDGFLGPGPAAEIAGAVRALASSGRLAPAGTGREARVDPEVRGDAIGWIDREAAPALGRLLDAFDALGAALTRDAWLPVGPAEVQVARYPAGAHYARHVDAFRGPASRRVTAIWYANPDWVPAHGGQLRLHLGPGGALARDIEPLLDRLVVFLSDAVEHEVLRAGAERLAVTAWYRAPAALL